MKSSAGTFESSDCLITLSDSNSLEIIIESIVKDQFGDQIETVIRETLIENNIDTIKVEIFDKGALDYTIKARLETAIARRGEFDE